MNSLSFHMECPHTGMAVCHCQLGAPSAVSGVKKSQEYFRQAKMLWEMWKNSHAASERSQGVDVLVPILYKREIIPFDDSSDERELPTQEEAEKEIEVAEKTARDATIKAAKMAAAAGIPYEPPAGVNVDLSMISRSDKPIKTLEALKKEGLKLETEIKMIEADKCALEASTAEQEHKLKEIIAAAEKKLAEAQTKKKRGRSKSTGHTNQTVPGASAHEIVRTAANCDPELSPSSTSHKRTKHHPRDERVTLKHSDFQMSLVGRQLQVFWPADRKWWNVTVLDIHAPGNKAKLLYETSETEEVNLVELIEAGEVAWLSPNQTVIKKKAEVRG